jgi:RNA recognition motif-containing protein
MSEFDKEKSQFTKQEVVDEISDVVSSIVEVDGERISNLKGDNVELAESTKTITTANTSSSNDSQIRPVLNTLKSRKLFLTNIHPGITEGQLIKLFQQFGEMKSIEYPVHPFEPLKGRPRGYCIIEMNNIMQAQKVYDKLNLRVMSNRTLHVFEYTDDYLNIHKRYNAPEDISRSSHSTTGMKRPLSCNSADSSQKRVCQSNDSRQNISTASSQNTHLPRKSTVNSNIRRVMNTLKKLG